MFDKKLNKFNTYRHGTDLTYYVWFDKKIKFIIYVYAILIDKEFCLLQVMQTNVPQPYNNKSSKKDER